MGKFKLKVAKFVADKFFKEEVKELKESYYLREKSKVEKEIKALENNLIYIQKEYRNLQQKKFIESVNADLSKQQIKEEQQEKSNNKNKDPFADWGV